MRMRPGTRAVNYCHDFKFGFANQSDEKPQLIRWLKRYFVSERPGALLDVGPADGLLTRAIAYKARSICLIEPNSAFHDGLRKRFPNAKLISRRIEDVKFSAPCFETILCSHVLYYIPVRQWADVFDKLRSWLLPNGRMIFILNAADSEWFVFVRDLAGLLKVNPGFHYLDANKIFTSMCGGAKQIETIESQFTLKDPTSDSSTKFLCEYVLQIPADFISEKSLETLKLALSFRAIRKRLTIRFRHLIGVWSA